MKKLSSVTSKLGQSYRAWKAAEKDKNESRTEFFALATEEVGKGGVNYSKVERVWGPTEGELLGRVLQQFPTWILREYDQIEGTGYFTVLLEENSEYRSYTYVNPEDGMVYTKQVVTGSPYLDDERLKTQDPELYEAVTYEKVERKLRPLDELSPKQLAKVQEFIYEGKPTVKLAAPRQAKPEELSENYAEVQ